jgi:hypothetical protein
MMGRKRHPILVRDGTVAQAVFGNRREMNGYIFVAGH